MPSSLRKTIPTIALVAATISSAVVVLILSLSYRDVRAAVVASERISLVSAMPDRTHVIQVRWRIGAYDPDHDMPGQYVYWTLLPREAMFVK